MSLFSYDAILIKEDGIETEICQVIAIIRTLTYVPILAIANIEFEEIKKIVYLIKENQKLKKALSKKELNLIKQI